MGYTKEADWKITKVCDVEIENLKKTVLDFHEEWLIDTSRQETYVTHENTFMYELIFFDYRWRPSLPAVCKVVNSFTGLAKLEIDAIYALLKEYTGGTLIHSEIISMSPGTRIRTHRDRGDALYLARRFHIPLKTNKETFFIVEEEKFYLEEGSIYELNNSKYHGVRNNSNETRIHLIVDYMPAEYSHLVEMR